MRAFRLTVDNALLFFDLCQELNLKTEAERLLLMDEMIRFGKVEQVTETNKTKEEYVKHLAKCFKVMQVESNGSIGYRMPDDRPKGDTPNGSN